MSELELEPVRVRVVEREPPKVPVLRGDAGTVAVAAVGGVVLGAAAVAAVRVVGSAARNSGARLLPRRRRQPKVVASRSFLVDVHLLGK